MDISNVAATSAIASSVPVQQAIPKSDKQVDKPQDSVVVKLSAQAQQLNRSADTARAPQVVAPAPANESKGGRVNTYA